MSSVGLETWWQLGLALALGLFVGLERERSGHGTGIRTFPLITIFGAAAALVSDSAGPWILPTGLLVVAAGMITTSRQFLRDGEEDTHGVTTNMAAFVMYVVGALLVLDYASVAVALGGTTAVLLHWKEPLHEFADRIGSDAIRAVYRFVLIAVVVLPVLPDRTFGPYDVFNPFRVWLIVSLIVGISVAGYIVYRFLGPRVGTILGGVLGGIVSSTAATVAYARRSRDAPSAAPAAAVAIMIAATLAFVRIVVEVLVVAPEVRAAVLPKFGLLIGLMTLASVAAYLYAPELEGEESAQPEDPAALKVAVLFGAMYLLILFAVAAAKQHFGQSGMYVVATLSGLTDVDAITLSTAEMMKEGRISSATGWRMMLIGGLSNVLFKGGAVAVLGHRRLLGWIVVLFGITLVGGVGIIGLWPA